VDVVMTMADRRDEGFTLTELIVVVTLITFVLAAAWATYVLVVRGRDTVDRQVWMSREVGAPLEAAERVFIQQHLIDKTYVQLGPYSCACYTDQDDDGKTEYWIFTATADGRLVMTNSEQVDRPTPRTTVWSTHNANRAKGVALFQYIDGFGNPITDTTRIASDARSMRITVVAVRDGKTLRDSRYVQFRNR
jgi:prepilin-type N-terminal cleavage/methylation domain-containing protein